MASKETIRSGLNDYEGMPIALLDPPLCAMGEPRALDEVICTRFFSQAQCYHFAYLDLDLIVLLL